MKKILNKKGMTLFELLAVIVILGIVAAIAFPTVNGLIENSRKDSFATNVNNFISAAVNDAKADYTSTGGAVTITYEITDENTISKSSGSLGFELNSGLTKGIIQVAVDTTGTATVTITDNFTNLTYSTTFEEQQEDKDSITRGEVTKTAYVQIPAV